MYKYLAFLALMIVPNYKLIAQDANSATTHTTTVDLDKLNSTPAIVKPAKDFVMLQFGYNNWVQKPDSIKTKGLGYTFGAYLCYDFPIKKTKLSFAAGLGVYTSVVFLDQQRIIDTQTVSGTPGAATFIPDSSGDKRYKFVTTYLQAPFELRYFSDNLNRNKGFKAAIGLDIGTLLRTHTKAVRTLDGTIVRDKTDTKRYLSSWNFAATARVGWGNFSLFGSYNLTNVFKQSEGPVITPVSVGFCLTGL